MIFFISLFLLLLIIDLNINLFYFKKNILFVFSSFKIILNKVIDIVKIYSNNTNGDI